MKLRNLYLGLKAQGPFKRFWHNFFVTGNARGLLYRRSHLNSSGQPKVGYSEASARKSAEKMGQKNGAHYSVYKCIYCDHWHLGRNRENKVS